MVSDSRLLEELRLEDEASFRNFFRMIPRMFHDLLQTLRSSVGVHCQYDALWFFMVIVETPKIKHFSLIYIPSENITLPKKRNVCMTLMKRVFLTG